MQAKNNLFAAAFIDIVHARIADLRIMRTKVVIGQGFKAFVWRSQDFSSLAPSWLRATYYTTGLAALGHTEIIGGRFRQAQELRCVSGHKLRISLDCLPFPDASG